MLNLLLKWTKVDLKMRFDLWLDDAHFMVAIQSFGKILLKL